ncbi:ABC transporter permease [Lentzea sp. NBRC 105346]|uniref:FecCD family ABC transporter permease n=1 Tax=Lentzea sp. NBRC 105346 TaxID=3032205 RepID=UPI0024A56FB1|nr:iron chelate uptake ABC transporter family permease subunit [Lentzea sp. NBRC 105346]GLZ33687.1 ABC transporter permease [Lentzea sp. NBRC 105346]
MTRVLLLLALLAVGLVTLTTGDAPVSLSEVVASLTGQGDRASDFIVLRLRLPRVLCAILVGAALGVAGALLQSLTRNPLGSPEIVGLTSGSATGAICVMFFLHGGMTAIALGAFLGGLLTASVVYLLAIRRGGQLVLVGIGVSFVLVAVNHFLITRASVEEALVAQAWLVGGLNLRTWGQVTAAGVGVAVLLPAAMLLWRRLTLMEMGDEIAQGLGVDVPRSRFLVLGTSVALAAVATAAAGPIGFVALAAPQLARRLAPGVLAAALMGALLLLASDLLVLRIFSVPLPVGIMTGAIGGLYLVWMLWRRTA